MKLKKPIPFQFVLDELEPLSPYTKPMFGCTAIYVEDKIVLILREREKNPEDNGVWVATTSEHHKSLKMELPSMRSIRLFGPGETGWQVIQVEDPSFEEEALKVCNLVLKRDQRIGKIPSSTRKKKKPLKHASSQRRNRR